MAKSFFETILARGGLAGESFDIAAGPADTGIIDVLLSAGDGVLTVDAPIMLTSTGALGATRDLDITALEIDDAGVDIGGRIFFLSVQNSDIAINDLTISPTVSVNGSTATAPFTISEASDWIFVHTSGGLWRAYRQSTTVAQAAMIFRADFAAADWAAGTANQIGIPQSGVAGAGEVGPHGLGVSTSYVVQVYRDANDRLVNLSVEVDSGTGDITLIKAPAAPAEDGRVIIVGL